MVGLDGKYQISGVISMADYYPHYTSSWSTSEKRVSQCESRHRLIVELENRESEMRAGDQVSVKLRGQDTRGWFNTKFKDKPGHKGELKIKSPGGSVLIQEIIGDNREYFYDLPEKGIWEIYLDGPEEAGSCSNPPSYVKRTTVNVSKNPDLADMDLNLGSLIEYRKGIAILVGVIILGVMAA
jgi:hypothetical protein